MEASDSHLLSRGYGAVLWEPDRKTIRDARITRFMSWLADGRGPRFDRYQELWQWSVTHPDRFWAAIWDYFDVLGEWDHDPASVLAGDTMPDVRWFPGATLNYARNALRTAWTDPDRTAIIFDSERSRAGALSYGQLAAGVARVARGLRSLGVRRGDRVAALLPNVPEAIIGLLATASLGAIWSSCSPDFGASSVIDRFAQIEPTVLIGCDGYGYGGKEFSRTALLADVAAKLPGLSAVVLVKILDDAGAEPPGLPHGARYRESYFDTYPGVWRHGDWIEILPDGGCVIYGRSDATLNRGGVRMGTSEFYRVVEALPEVGDSLVVDTGQLGADGRLLLFVVPAPGCELDDDLKATLRAALRAQLTPRHVPDEIHQVPGIPRTLSGKKLEIPVRKILLGSAPERAADPNALANPDALGYFAEFRA